MTSEQIILVSEFCLHYHADTDFVRSLHEYGLIPLVERDADYYVPAEELSQLEKLTRMHYEMDINLEGIETIVHLLQRVDAMQEEMRRLRNRLRRYEDL